MFVVPTLYSYSPPKALICSLARHISPVYTEMLRHEALRQAERLSLALPLRDTPPIEYSADSMTLRHTERFHFPPNTRRSSSLCHWRACPRLSTSGSWAKCSTPSSRSQSYQSHLVSIFLSSTLVMRPSIYSSVYALCDSSHGKRVSRRWIRREPESSPACCSSWTCTRSSRFSSSPTWCVERVARGAACTRSPALGCSRCRSYGIASRKRKWCSIVPTLPSQSTAFRLATTRAASTCSAGAHCM